MMNAHVPNKIAEGRYHNGGNAFIEGRPWLVMLHGAGMEHSVWQQQSRSLAQICNVVAVDLPGHGQSPDCEIQSIKDYAQWTMDLLQTLGAVPAKKSAPAQWMIAGHSMGASVAIELAALAQEQVKQLYLINAGLTMPVHPQLLSDTQDNPQAAIDFIARYGYSDNGHRGRSSVPGAWLPGASVAMLARGAAKVLHRDFELCNNWSGQKAVEQIVCPVSVLVGSQDKMTPVKSANQLAAAFKQGTVQVVKNSGHMLPVEAPHLVREAFMHGLAAMRPS